MIRLLCLLLSVVGLLSCSKSEKLEPVANSIEGNWRMIMTKENGTGIVSIKSPALEGNVELSFLAATTGDGHFIGKTPTNEIWLSNYVASSNNALHIPYLSMTKVMETDWGLQFVDNILNAEKYSFDKNGNLVITTAQVTLTFKRI